MSPEEFAQLQSQLQVLQAPGQSASALQMSHGAPAPGGPGFVGMRMWIEQEVDAHVRKAMREIGPYSRPSDTPLGNLSLAAQQQLADQDIKQRQMANGLGTVEQEQHRLASEMRQLRQHYSIGAEHASRNHRAEAGVVRELFSHGSPARSRDSPERITPTPSKRAEEPDLRTIRLNLADQVKGSRALAQDMATLKDSLTTLREEVRTIALATDTARHTAEEASFGKGLEASVHQAMRASWQQLSQGVVDEALRRNSETWNSHHAAIEALHAQHQAVQQQLCMLLEQPPKKQVLEERHQHRQGPPDLKPTSASRNSRGVLNVSWEAALADAQQQHSPRPHHSPDNLGLASIASSSRAIRSPGWGAEPAGFGAGPSWEPNASVEESLIAQLESHQHSVLMENGAEFTLGWEEAPQAFQDSPQQVRHTRQAATENDAYAAVLARLRRGGHEATPVQMPLSAEKPEELAKPEPVEPAAAPSEASGRKKTPRRVRPTSRWQVGHDFSSDSDSDDGGNVLAPFSRHLGKKEFGAQGNKASEASKRSVTPAKHGARWANAARARLGFSSDSDGAG